jgi:hypothetical protein
MGKGCSINGREKESIWGFHGKARRKDQDIDGMIILKLVGRREIGWGL